MIYELNKDDLSIRRLETSRKNEVPVKIPRCSTQILLIEREERERGGKFHLPAQIATRIPVVQQQWIDKSGSVQLFAEKAFDQETRKRRAERGTNERTNEERKEMGEEGKRKRTVLVDRGQKEGKIYGGHFIESDPVADHLRGTRTSVVFLSFFFSSSFVGSYVIPMIRVFPFPSSIFFVHGRRSDLA